jgi:glutaredoxin 3
MEFEKPSENDFTIYSKSGCPNCLKVKALLKDKQLKFNIINSDEYIIENKENFLLFIKELCNKEVKTFPVIFFNKEFIGGYNETVEFVNELLLSFDTNF